MAPPSQSTFATFGLAILIFRKLGYIPFGWDRQKEQIVTFRKSRRLQMAHKWIVFALLAANLYILTLGVVRSTLNSHAAALKKLQNVFVVLMYWIFLRGFIIVFKVCDGIPVLISNLQKLCNKTGRNSLKLITP